MKLQKRNQKYVGVFFFFPGITCMPAICLLYCQRKRVHVSLSYTFITAQLGHQSFTPSFLGVLSDRLLVDDEKRASSLVQEEYHRALNSKTELARREKETAMTALHVQIQMQAA